MIVKFLLKKIIIYLLILFFVIIVFIPRTYLNNYIKEIPIVFNLTIPVELSISRIGINAPIVSVGILDGAMDVPLSESYVGWYNLGSNFGDIGTTVFAGHVNWRNGIDAVFTNLKKIQIGDIIRVKDNYLVMHYFIVHDIKRYPINSDTTEVFSSNDGLKHLNLITCDGAWNEIKKTHELRLVIFADKI